MYEQVEEEIERELAEVTFEELQKARSDGSEVLYRKPTADTKGGRSNKNRLHMHISTCLFIHWICWFGMFLINLLILKFVKANGDK